ncbi:cytosolic phospholipase A2 [Entomortierella parvispora]|uniref:Lysophospholipase n=1 Tax=Entomortierella parvispora TaxID=205924 RepID=A0A9P3HHQ8_9FUNG|nr:cytosolic phospholipase A2 [Entomortierella parvispora]
MAPFLFTKLHRPTASHWRLGRNRTKFALLAPHSGPWRPLLLPVAKEYQRHSPFSSSTSRGNGSNGQGGSSKGNNENQPQPNETRWDDLKSSAVVLLGVCSAILMPSNSKTAACEDPKHPKAPVLGMKTDPTLKQEDSKDQKSKDAGKDTPTEDGDKIKLPGPLPSIPIPKMPTLSMDDIMDKFHSLGEKIGDEIKDRVPTLADYFMAVDTIRKELQLGDGSLYQSIVANMSDSNKNPEIQLDATVRTGNSLCPQEAAFQVTRKKKMKKAFAKFIGVKESEVHESDIPIVALAGSGGGYRAMISSLGYMTAAKKSGLFECTMYMAGVSGSCWMIAQYLTLGQRSFTKTMEHFKQSLNTPIAHYPSFIDTMLTNPGAAQLILEGVVQKYSKNRVLTLVDAFGTVLASRLLIHRERDGDNGEWVDPLDFKLSQQSRWTNYGDQPLPIYTAVSHVLPGSSVEAKLEGEVVVEDDVASEDDDGTHYYQWFEMTPYEFGSEETSAWIPTWAFGRRFVEGKSVERLPETNLAILLGTFGSAFTATLADYYKEVRPLLNKAMSDSMDSYIKAYLDGMKLIHPLSPSCFPNPIYKLPNPEPEAELFSQRKNIYLNDAGMDNNLPLYPLLRPGRKIDVILAFDSSADIESVPWFEKTDEYVKRRGIKRWPPISKTRAEQLEKQEGGPPRKMTHVEIFHGIVADDREADHVDLPDKTATEPNAQPATQPTQLEANASSTDADAHPITLIYFPLIPNPEYKEDFNPGTDPFCSTFNFEIKEDQVELLAGLGERNFSKGLEDVRRVLKETWLRKKHARLEREKRERRSRKHAPEAPTSPPSKK